MRFYEKIRRIEILNGFEVEEFIIYMRVRLGILFRGSRVYYVVVVVGRFCVLVLILCF